MRICGATETILPYAVDYGFWIILATPFYSATFVLSNVVRQEGNVRLATIGTIAGAVVNIILDPILIFGFHLGIVGAAVATSLSQIVSFAILFSSIWGDGCVLKLRIQNFKPNRKMMGEIIKIGAPNLFQSGLLIVAQILMNNAAGVYGDAPLAGMNVVNKVSHIIILGLNGFAMGFQPMCGYCFGAKLYKRVKEGLIFTLQVGLAIVTALCVITYIFAPQIIALFRADDLEVIDVGSRIMRAHVLVMPLACVTMVANSLRTGHQGRHPGAGPQRHHAHPHDFDPAPASAAHRRHLGPARGGRPVLHRGHLHADPRNGGHPQAAAGARESSRNGGSLIYW